MARPIESQLYRELVESRFNFIGRGPRKINEIYESVQHRFPGLCDDDSPCLHMRNDAMPQPEWKHAVRRALNACKNRGDDLDFGGRRGLWIFT